MMLRVQLFIIIFIYALRASGQSDEINSLTKSFNRFQSKNIQEKIFVHTDRNFYVTGEVLWFKIYCAEAVTNIPIDLSKVAYVELMNTENKAILQIKVILDKGVGSGSLFLPASINSGNYVLRAYTHWMKNFDAEFFFHQQLTIVNTFKNLDVKGDEKKEEKSISLKFFPEGGSLVNGLHATVAFKITDAAGKGVNANGIVTDSKRNTVARFTTHRFGMGTFNFSPQPNHVYKAHILSDKSNPSFTLPIALDSGCTLQLSESENRITLSVKSTYQPGTPVYLAVHSASSLKAVKANVIINGKTQFAFSRDQLGAGTIHFTLFDAALNPVAERLFFIKSKNAATIAIATDKGTYYNRQKIVVTLTASDSLLSSNFNGSMSVHAFDSLLTTPATDISAHFGLLSELRGSVDHPEYYLGSDADAAKALDNLMLVHGWSRYSWHTILHESDDKHEILYLPELKGHLITGTITNKYTGKPVPEAMTLLGAPSKIIRSYVSLSDVDGKIYFEMKDFFDAQRVFVQVQPEDKDSVKILINDPFAQKFSSFAPSGFKLGAASEQALLQKSVAMQSLSIFQPTYLGKLTSLKNDSINFYGKADEDYKLDDYTRFKSMEEVLREYVPGVMVRKRKENFTMRVINRPANKLFEKHPLVLLDGVPIFDADKIMNYDPLKIKRLEVMTQPYFVGALEADGIVSFTSYRGLAEGLEIDPATVSLDYEGLQSQREFYSPDYSTVAAIQNRAADFRDLLYWNPSVTLDKDGKTQLEFYSSDKVGRYEINFQGMNKEGKVASGRSYIFVTK